MLVSDKVTRTKKIITCIDPRLTKSLDEQRNALIFRDAGGLVGPYKNEIRRGDLEVKPHTKCGLVKFVFVAIRDGVGDCDQMVVERVIAPFKNHVARLNKVVQSAEELETHVLNIQKNAMAKGMSSKKRRRLRISYEQIDTDGLTTQQIPSDNRVLAVCMPLYTERMTFTRLAESAGLDMDRTFFTTLPIVRWGIEREMMTDAIIAKIALNAKRVVLFKDLADSREDMVDGFGELLRRENFGLPIERREYNSVRL